MSVLRKVPASAGAHWVLGSLALLRRAPLALCTLGALWGMTTMLVLAISAQIDALGAVGPYLIVLAGPMFMGGMLWAVREVDMGRTPRPFHLLAGVVGERPIHLLMFLLPQFLISVLMVVMLLVLLGLDGLGQLKQVILQLSALSEAGVPLDPVQVKALWATLPVWILLLCALLALVFFASVTLPVLVMLPLVMFDNVNGLRALRYSLYAYIYNLRAMLVFLVCLCATLGVVYFAVMQVMGMLSVLVSPGLAVMLAQLLLVAVLMPLLAGSMYAAWKHMLAPADAPPPPSPPDVLQA